jgi:hypothetical protein
MNVRLSERDLKMLAKCAAAKWLTTGQLQRLYFQSVTADAARKSLRRLATAGYLTAFRENRMAEALHAVGPKSKAILEGKGISVELSRTPPRQIEHLVGLNDIRVAVEAEPDRVAYFFACWELGKLGWAYPLIPDAVFALKRPERHTFVLEYDRGTETAEMLLHKLQSYEDGLSGFLFRALILVTDSTQRLAVVLRQLSNRPLRLQVWGASIADIRSSGMYATIFRDARQPNDEMKSFWDASGEAASAGDSAGAR